VIREAAAQLRLRVGEGLLHLAFFVLGTDIKDLPEVEDEHDESDFDTAPPVPVMMGDRAKEMVQQGMRAEPHTRTPVQPAPLAGSLQERYANERAALGRR
jgi:hypothetical protein